MQGDRTMSKYGTADDIGHHDCAYNGASMGQHGGRGGWCDDREKGARQSGNHGDNRERGGNSTSRHQNDEKRKYQKEQLQPYTRSGIADGSTRSANKNNNALYKQH